MVCGANAPGLRLTPGLRECRAAGRGKEAWMQEARSGGAPRDPDLRRLSGAERNVDQHPKEKERRRASAQCWCRCQRLGVTERELRVCAARHPSSETNCRLARPSLPSQPLVLLNPISDTVPTSLPQPAVGSAARPTPGSPEQSLLRLPQPPGVRRGGACADW